jgi:type II secretion system protein D
MTKPPANSWRIAAALLAAALGVCLWPNLLRAQGGEEFAARRYPLRYVAPQRVLDQLETTLRSVRDPSGVAFDAQQNAIIVQGSEEAHRLAAQLVGTLDRPANARDDLPASAEDVIESISVPPELLEQVAQRLREKFPRSTGAKFAVDERGGQVLALAPPALQREISKFIEQLQAAPAAALPAEPMRPRDVSPATARLQLKHIRPQALEQGLSGIWGRQLPVTLSPDGKHSEVVFPAIAGQKVTLKIDRTTGSVQLDGPAVTMHAWRRVVMALDAPQDNPRRQTAVMPLRYSERGKVEIALAAFRAGSEMRWGGDLVARIFQPEEPVPPPVPDPDPELPPLPDQPPADGDPPPAQPVDDEPPAAEDLARDDRGVIGPVQVEFLEGLDVLVIRGNKRDVERVVRIIEDIERLSAETEPQVEVHHLEHADNEAVVPIINELFTQFFAPRFGRLSMTPLVKPNAVLIIGRPDGVAAAKDLIAKVDQPVAPNTLLRVFPLRYMPAADALTRMTEFYQQRGGLGTRLRLMADYRSNSLVVQASPRDIAEVASMLEALDVGETPAVSEVKVFRLRNSLAEDLAPVIENAIRGDQFSQGTAQGGGQGAQNRQQQIRSTMLTLSTIDSEGGRLLRSGILTDVQVNADPRTNALVVRGPPEAMELIGALINQLDQLPGEAQIKVFTIVNGDAASLAETLAELFGTQQAQGGQPGVALGAGQGETSLVPLRFSVDLRTNSIVASGTAADLEVVEAILLRLDEGDIRERITVVYRLQNSPALDVAAAINEFLTSERAVQTLPQGEATPFEQIEREVVVVPEPVSNSLIVSASPRYFEEIRKIVEKLDERPPMVLIQVVIAEISLNDVDEVGVELGIQDSLLFDRSAIVNGLLDPGFNFNNRPLGNSSAAESVATRETLAGQALSNFGLGRTNTALGYGGLVLSASNESLSVLIRALQDERSLQILSRPQVMTLDNQPAFIQVGQRVPRITSSNIVNNAIINNTTLENVGILLGVTPRISPDGQVVMEIDAEKSEVGPEAEGIPISINENGDVIRSPRINIITAQTTVSARSGQTVILGGLITRRTFTATRRAPWISDIPVFGNLFRFDTVEEGRGELLFIMTPFIVRGDQDIEQLKTIESGRMSWCLADVINVHGDVGLSGAYESMPGRTGGPVVVYPSAPGSATNPEDVPASEYAMPEVVSDTPLDVNQGPPPAAVPVPVPVPVPVVPNRNPTVPPPPDDQISPHEQIEMEPPPITPPANFDELPALPGASDMGRRGLFRSWVRPAQHVTPLPARNGFGLRRLPAQ